MYKQQFSLDKAQKCADGGIFVEVGTWQGDFSAKLLETTTCKKLYCVDPYKHFASEEYPDAINNLTQEQFDNVFNTTRKRLERFGARIQFIRLASKDAVDIFEDNSIDFVYIDGNHEYKYVDEDINLWFPKVKNGGYLCGDDVCSYDLAEHDTDNNVTKIWATDNQGKPISWGKYGVYPACLNNEKRFGIKFTFEDNQFSYKKV
jgi:hypothetical protein